MTNILVICHGNINRSPFAAAVMQHYGGIGLSVISAGFVNPGTRAAKKMRDAAKARGYDLGNHRSQLVTRELLEWAEVVVYMDGGNYKRLTNLLNGDGVEVTTTCLAKWASPELERIPDPGFMARASSEFAATVEIIEEAAREFANEMIA